MSNEINISKILRDEILELKEENTKLKCVNAKYSKLLLGFDRSSYLSENAISLVLDIGFVNAVNENILKFAYQSASDMRCESSEILYPTNDDIVNWDLIEELRM